MGSVQQISLGVICLVAAFMFGNYVNNHPDPEKVSHALSNSVTPAPVESRSTLLDSDEKIQQPAPTGALSNSTSSRMPTQSLGLTPGSAVAKAIALPPPSQLDQPPATMPGKQSQMPNLLEPAKRREIVVPDFSELAKEFKNTPLELPPMQRLSPAQPNSNLPFSKPDSIASWPTTGVSPMQVPMSTNAAPANSLAGDAPYQVQAIPADFNSEDFTPKLRDRFESNPTTQLQTEPPTAESRFGSHNPNDSVVTNTIVRSYQELSSRSESNSVLIKPVDSQNTPIQSESLTAGNPERVAGNNGGNGEPDLLSTAPAQTKYQAAKPLIPFGLTPESKSKLIQLNRSVSNQVPLGTTRFADYTTQPGDSLQQLSTRYYGRPDFYLDIYLANRNLLRNPAQVPTGISLRIPLYE